MSSVSQPLVSGIVLAAGFGRRMGGGGPKLLLPLGGEPVLARTLRNALASRLDEVLLVLGHGHREILRAVAPLLTHPRARAIRNGRPEGGRISSIRVGLSEVDPGAGSALFLCGDHPLVGPGLIDRLRDLHERGGYLVSFPVLEGRKGHPTLWRREAWPALLGLEGETGTGDLALGFGERAGKLPLEDATSQLDLNTQDDYARLLEAAPGEVTT